MHDNVLTSNQLDQFKEAIESCLVDHYQHHWFPDRPTKGSGYRCIRINHKMDPILSRAGQSCGIDSKDLRTIFPNELTLWVDPAEVSYRIGENGSICVLFDGHPNDNEGKCLKPSKTPLKTSGNNNKTRTTSGGRGSPTDSTLSSSTSTMSSPSPSSSPDYIRFERQTSPDNWRKIDHSLNGHHQQNGTMNGHHVRSSPVNMMSPPSGLGFGLNSMDGYAYSHHHQPYHFTPGVVNGVNGGSHHHSSPARSHGPPSSPQQQSSLFTGYSNGWGSPFRN